MSRLAVPLLAPRVRPRRRAGRAGRRGPGALYALLALAGLVAGAVRPPAALAESGTPDPPVDAPDDADVTFERADTSQAAGVEVELGLSGTDRAAPRRDRTMRIRGDDLDGTIREGSDDPLSGAELGGAGGATAWRMSRVAPQWGRGWLVGAPLAPWGVAPRGAALGLRTGPRGDAAQISLGDAWRLDGLVGHFARRDVAALRVGSGGASVALATTRGGLALAGVGLERDSIEAELSADRARRWRAEAALASTRAGGRFTLLARAGSSGLRAFLAPTRSGPGQALAAGWDAPPGRVSPRARAALWRFAPGFDGARGALEVDLALAQHASLTFGCEEQRGTRRERTASRGMRQGWWGEWCAESDPVRLELRVETWGREAWGRRTVRAVSGAAVEWRTPFDGRLRAAYRVFRSGSGEGLRLPELDADRLVLRALSGAGERTDIEMILPGPAGRLRAGLSLTGAELHPPRTQWTIHWARRARVGRAAP